MRLFNFKSYSDKIERKKDFIRNLPEPLKTNLRQEMVDSREFSNKLDGYIDKIYTKLVNYENMENFFIYLTRYNNSLPGKIFDIIDEYLSRKIKK
jgi:hypothetical protein